MTDISDAAEAVEADINFNTSVQKLLNGPGFSEKYMLGKARRELVRLKDCKHAIYVYDHITNFSVAVASLADWTFHFKLAADLSWNGRNEVNFANWIRSTNRSVAAFIDIANELKHADRKHPNFAAEKVVLYATKNPSPDQILKFSTRGFESQNEDGENWFVIPLVKFDSKFVPLYDMAEEVLKWWETVDLTLAVPMGGKLTSL